MSTLTPNYELIVPEATDTLEQVRADYATNLNTIDGIGGGGSGGHTIINPSGTSMPQETGLQFTGNVNVTDDSVNSKTIVDIPAGSGSGHTIINPSGTSMTQRGGLKFTGSVTVTDDSVNNETIVNVSGGGGVNYSTIEQVVGTFIDGKPIYQRTWTGTKSTTADEAVISGFTTLDTLVDARVIFKGNTGAQIAQYFRDASDFGRCWYDNNEIHMDLGSSYPIRPVTWYITLLYTKTTDT